MLQVVDYYYHFTINMYYSLKIKLSFTSFKLARLVNSFSPFSGENLNIDMWLLSFSR